MNPLKEPLTSKESVKDTTIREIDSSDGENEKSSFVKEKRSSKMKDISFLKNNLFKSSRLPSSDSEIS